MLYYGVIAMLICTVPGKISLLYHRGGGLDQRSLNSDRRDSCFSLTHDPLATLGQVLSTILSKLHCPSRDEVTSKYWHWNSITKLEAWTWFQVLQRPLNISFSDLKVHNFTAWLFPAVGQQRHLYELFLPKTEVWHFLRFSPCLVTFPKSENCPFLLHSLCLVIRKRQYTRPCYLRIKWLKLLALKLQYIGIYKPMGRKGNKWMFSFCGKAVMA